MGEARQFKFGVQIGTSEYFCKHNRFPLQGHVTSLIFGKIADSVSEMVQARDIVTNQQTLI